MGTNIKYNAVMVADLADGVKTWCEMFGLEPLNSVSTNQFGVTAQMLGVDGEPVMEIMTPANPDTALARMMEERKNERNPQGEGLYMMCLEVDDIDSTISSIESKGGKIIREEGNSKVAWVHPLNLRMVLVELQEKGYRNLGAAGG
tara:strand:- start:1756 stop:2193 length:438 start_codon:yes stop_codon:yes gene_type:complete